MARASSALTIFVLLLPLASCCSISQGLSALFCGPRPALPRRSYLTPKAALGTLLGAISSDDSRTIYESIGQDMKGRMGIGRLEWEIAWTQIKEQTPGIHLADQAEISEPVHYPATASQPFDLVGFTLRLPLTRIEVVLRQYAYWRVISRLAGTEDAPEEDSDYVESLTPYMLVQSGSGRSPIRMTIPGPQIEGLHESEILAAGVAREWLVFDFRILPD